MKTKINALMMLALTGALLIGCKPGKKDGNKEDVIGPDDTPYQGLVGRPVKRTYSGLTGSAIASLNYLSTSAAANATHFANFVEGLVSHDSFGVLQPNLAESAKHNADYTEFEFTLRDDDNMVWSTYEGKPYTYNGEVQKVKASDFVEGAKTICNFTTKSDTFYLMRDFISGAYEYYLYTQILDGQANALSKFLNMDTPEKQAAFINEEIALQENVYIAGGYEDNPVTAEDINFIESGSRLGVRADDENRKVTYKLMQSAMYFPTLLTYSTYLPVNAHFKKEKGSKFGTSKADSILYNGPFILSQSDETTISYKKNEQYHERKDVKAKGNGYKVARIDTLTYHVIKGDIDADYTRVQFESGNVDGFSLSKNDQEGWEKYITGPDGSGTYEDPYDGKVNARLLDTIGNCYGTNIIMERTKQASSKKSYATGGNSTTIANTEKALRLLDVRKALMKGFDYPTYFSRYADGDPTDILARQECVHTYVPRNFVYDDNGNEYTEYYYASELAKVKGISLESAQALIEPGQFDTRQAPLEEVYAAVDKAVESINLYNASAETKITLPIQIEFLSEWYDDTSKMFDTKFINSMNKRMNKGEENEANWIFKFIPTDKLDSSKRDTVTGSEAGSYAAWDMSGVMWGWGADYGDPLTYMNTYTKGGDWGSVFGYINLDNVPTLENKGGVLVESNLLEEYTALVKAAQNINDDLNSRYQKFAEAEVLLIEKLAIYMPQINNGQGWSFSISNSAGYEMPQSNYGLSNDRLTGMFMLKEPLSRAERTSIRAEFDQAKKDYTSSHPTYNIYE